MTSQASDSHRLSVPELNLLELLATASVTWLDCRTGKVRWALDAEDVCSLVELAVDLLDQWEIKTSAGAWTQAARLLGVPTDEDADATMTDRATPSPSQASELKVEADGRRMVFCNDLGCTECAHGL